MDHLPAAAADAAALSVLSDATELRSALIFDAERPFRGATERETS